DGLRARQMKNLLTLLLVAHGTPMLLMGDEMGRTQGGNNNAYCQDNETSWLDWRLADRNAGLLRFVRELVRFRAGQSVFRAERFWSSPGAPRLTWHGVAPFQPDWGPESRSLAFTVSSPSGEEQVYVALSAYWGPLHFRLPAPERGQRWHRVVDTALPP